MSFKEIKTGSGFVCQVSDQLQDDQELVEILAGEYPNESYRNADLAKHVLGDQKPKLYEHLKKRDGMVRATAVNQELQDIFAALGDQGKN